MRRNTRRKALTNKQGTAGERGGVTLETALVMPVFLMLVFFLLFLVQTSITAMALHGALSQTVRAAASAWYPITLLQEEEDPAQDQETDWKEKLSGVKETVGAFGEWLPSPLGEWAEAISEGNWSPEEEAAKAVLGRMAMQFADTKVLAAERFRVTSVELPQKGNVSEAYLTLEAEYRLPFQVPFSGRPLAIRTSARERVWSGGSPSHARQLDPDEGVLDVTFVSLEPNPVRPGRKATLVLRTRPGAALDLSILYKSGNSQAKHLGIAAADDSGLVSWTWHVSGNTTPGQWSWMVRGEDGASFTMPFRVESK